jgi:hypothetical protein
VELFAPAHTPQAVISQFAKWFTGAMQTPELKAKLNELGFFRQAFVGRISLPFCGDDYGRVIRSANIRAD